MMHLGTLRPARLVAVFALACTPDSLKIGDEPEASIGSGSTDMTDSTTMLTADTGSTTTDHGSTDDTDGDSGGDLGSSGTTWGTTWGTTAVTGTGPGSFCGDGNVDLGEECDPDFDTPECTLECKFNVCGDGVLYEGVEECDPDFDTPECTPECKFNVCGDGFINVGAEGCDDGNNVDGDGCDAMCAPETCGDSKVSGTELCDDGNADNTDMCTTLCKAPACDDKLESGSETDVDCGGAMCPKCDAGKACKVASDCASNVCKDTVCVP